MLLTKQSGNILLLSLQIDKLLLLPCKQITTGWSRLGSIRLVNESDLVCVCGSRSHDIYTIYNVQHYTIYPHSFSTKDYFKSLLIALLIALGHSYTLQHDHSHLFRQSIKHSYRTHHKPTRKLECNRRTRTDRKPFAPQHRGSLSRMGTINEGTV
jgi:hypothetical protein